MMLPMPSYSRWGPISGEEFKSKESGIDSRIDSHPTLGLREPADLTFYSRSGQVTIVNLKEFLGAMIRKDHRRWRR